MYCSRKRLLYATIALSFNKFNNLKKYSGTLVIRLLLEAENKIRVFPVFELTVLLNKKILSQETKIMSSDHQCIRNRRVRCIYYLKHTVFHIVLALPFPTNFFIEVLFCK